MPLSHANLQARLDRLAVSLLPTDKPFGGFMESEEDRLRAYILLVHAEIEFFLEELGKDVVEAAVRVSTAVNCRPVVSRLIYMKTKGTAEITRLTPDLISGVTSFYEGIVDNNHGLRALHLMRLFMPLGLTHRDFDEVFLGNLEAFGRKRGGIAHSSIRLIQGTQPSTERRKVNDIADYLKTFEVTLRSLG
jgi:hypothetical protein